MCPDKQHCPPLQLWSRVIRSSGACVHSSARQAGFVMLLSNLSLGEVENYSSPLVLYGFRVNLCAVRGSFLVIRVDHSSEDGRWHGMSDVSQQAPLSTASVMVACHSKQRCLRAQLGTPGWSYVVISKLSLGEVETMIFYWFHKVIFQVRFRRT